MEVYPTFPSHFAGKKKSEKLCTASSCTTQLRYALQNSASMDTTRTQILGQCISSMLTNWDDYSEGL